MIEIEARNLSFIVDRVELLRDISLTIARGTRTAILGGAGSGKSLLLKLLAGILTPTSGQVLFRGQDWLTMGEKENLEARRVCGFLFQDNALWENKTIFQNLELPLRFHYPDMPKSESARRVEEALQRAGILHEAHNRPAVLSQGEARLAGFQRALILSPEVLFLDQPDTFLDRQGQEYVMQVMHEFRRQGKTLIFIPNHFDWVVDLSTHLILLEAGRMVIHGPTSAVLHQSDPMVKKILEKVSGVAAYSDDILNLLEGDRSDS